jgi:multisubunit Na+/H+ antiporter MnhB subunit
VPEDFVADSDGAPLEEGLSEEEEAERARALPPLREVAEIRKPSTLGGVVYLIVLGAAVVGVVVAATGAWRTGVSWLALALIGAAVTRVVLPDDNAGMLRVRRKFLDAAILTGAGVALLVLATTIPNQPG